MPHYRINLGLALLALAASPAMAQASGGVVTVADDGQVTAQTVHIPLSRFLSPEARAMQREKLTNPPSLPQGDDWIAQVRLMSDEIQGDIQNRWAAIFPVNITSEVINGVRTDVVVPADGVVPENADRVLINLHGGGFFTGGGAGGRAEAVPVAGQGRIKVVAVDYRLGPEHQFPAASEDVESVYRALLKDYPAQNIGIYGCSAGGALTAQAMAWFLDRELPLPGAIGVFCSGLIAPFYYGGDSASFTPPMNGNAQPDAEVRENGRGNPYLGMPDGADPLVSPAASDEVLASFPPTLFVTGTRDTALSNVLASNSLLIAHGVETELFVQEGLGHQEFNDFVGTPEAMQAHELIWRFFDRHLGQ